MTAALTARDGSETTGTTPRRAHFGGFELLRALAAVMVVVHHASTLAGPDRSGELYTVAAVADGGVAVFFVLSGFLIYRPFVAASLDARAPQPARAFYWRRILRIVPAYWVTLTFFWALGTFSLGSDWWRYYLFVQIYSRETVLGGVVQAWSLCTEMSFYLLLPAWAAGVAWLARRAETTRARVAFHLGACGALLVAGWVSRWVIEQHFPAQRGISFNWLPTNLDLFGTGMALAAVWAWTSHDEALRLRLGTLARPVAPWWAAAAVLFAWYAYQVGPADFAVGYSGWFWHRRQLLLAAVTALAMVPAVFGPQRGGLARRVWSWRPLVWLGGVSYGLYLWHFDWMKRSIRGVDGFGTELWPGWIHTDPGASNFWWLLAVGLGVGSLFAALSWYLLEEPLAKFKDLVGRASVARRG